MILSCGGDRDDAQLHTFLAVSLALHVFGQVPLGLEAEVTILASERPHVGVGPDVFLQHGGFLTADTTGVADIFATTPTSDVGVVIIRRLEPSLHCPHWLAVVNLLKLKNIKGQSQWRGTLVIISMILEK